MSALQGSNPVPWALLWEKTSSAVPELPLVLAGALVHQQLAIPTVWLLLWLNEDHRSINSGHISSNGKVSRGTFFSLVNFIV